MTRAEELAQRRVREIKTIKTCARQLKLDDDTYRDLLRRVSAEHGPECSSAKDLDAKQRKAVIAELRRSGAEARSPAAGYPGRPHNAAKLPDYFAKVEALLADMGLSWAYADAIVKRQYGVYKVAWIKKDEHWIALIAALSVEQFKRRAAAWIDAEMRRRGLSDIDLACRGVPKNWRRNKALLKHLLEWLGNTELLNGEGAQS